MLKIYLINNDFFLENVMDFENRELHFLLRPNVVGIATIQGADEKSFSIYATDDRGAIDFIIQSYDVGEERIVVSSKTREGLNSKIYEALSQIKEGLDDITVRINTAMSNYQSKDDITPNESLDNMEKSDTNLFTR